MINEDLQKFLGQKKLMIKIDNTEYYELWSVLTKKQIGRVLLRDYETDLHFEKRIKLLYSQFLKRGKK